MPPRPRAAPNAWPAPSACSGPEQTMDLLLWRHAEAADGMTDLARPLTPRGRKQAAAVAAWLQRHAPGPLDIFVSPAVRTCQTADALGRPYQVAQPLGPSADAARILAAIDWQQATRPILVVGHQPTLGQLASRLVTGRELPWHVEKGGLWWISCLHQDDDAFLRAVLDPDLL
jgi:phosphohistidine phosphatase